MIDRFISRSSTLALALASLGAISGCESNKSEDVTSVSRAATTGLVAGDIAITCFDSNVDKFEITALVPLESGTDLKLSDNEADSAGVFNTGEAINETIPLPAGLGLGQSLIYVPTTGLSATDESVFLYQGSLTVNGTTATLTGGNLLWGMQVSTGGAWLAGGVPVGNESALPTALAGANLALDSNTPAAAVFFTYIGTMSGTKAELLTAIRDPLNWSRSATTGTCPQITLNVTAPDGGDADAAPSDADTDSATGTGGSGGVDAATGAGGATGSGGVTGAGGTTGTDGGAGGVVGSTGGTTGGTGGVAGTDAGTGGVVGSTGGVAGTDAGTGGVVGSTGGTSGGTDAGAGGTTGAGGSTDAGAGGTTGAGGSTDAGTDVRADAGADAGTDVRADAGTDVKADAGTDVKADAAQDSAKPTGSSGCSCSTTVGRDGMSTSAWLLAIAGILFTARRKRRG